MLVLSKLKKHLQQRIVCTPLYSIPGEVMLGYQPGDGSPRKVAKVQFSSNARHKSPTQGRISQEPLQPFLSPQRDRISQGPRFLSPQDRTSPGRPELFLSPVQQSEKQIREERFGSFVTVLMPKRREFEEVQIPTSAMTPPKQQTTAMSESAIASFYSSANQSQMESYANFLRQSAELQAAQKIIQELQLSLQIAQQTNPSLSLQVIH